MNEMGDFNFLSKCDRKKPLKKNFFSKVLFSFLFDFFFNGTSNLLHHIGRLEIAQDQEGPKTCKEHLTRHGRFIEKVCLHSSKDCYHCKLFSIHKIILP